VQSNLKLLAKEIIHADFDVNRQFVQGKYYSMRTSPKDYLRMGRGERLLERLWFWLQLVVFGFYLAAMGLLAASDTSLEPLVLIGAVIIAIGAVYRVLVVQAYLRWMYAHRHRS
jgi:hypothetical protein